MISGGAKALDLALKKMGDTALAVFFLALLSPVFVLVALVVKATSKGSILFIQNRVGLGCKIFKIYKFRTMVSDADTIGGFQTQKNDARITPVGRILRISSLDELPQLINVIRGDMSLVGPRPDTPMQEKFYSEMDWKLRHSVRPGITGLAQVSIRSNGTVGERRLLDLWYVQNRSLRLDALIILKTVLTVLQFSSAN